MAAPRIGVRCVDGLLDVVGDARIVLLGEATHGTDEFYRLRRSRLQPVVGPWRPQPRGRRGRERHDEDMRIVVFTTHTGTLTAAVEVDDTTALRPLERRPRGGREPDERFPGGP